MAKNDAPENPLALDPKIQKEKREANEDRLNERREQGLVRSFDRTDSNIGWDAQQGALPAQDPQGIYADDPVRYAPEQLPDPEVLREAGLDPVISRAQVADGDQDGDDRALAGHDGGPQTGNVTEDRELKEVDTDGDAPLTAEDANAQKNAAENKSSDDDSSKRTKKKSSSKKS